MLALILTRLAAAVVLIAAVSQSAFPIHATSFTQMDSAAAIAASSSISRQLSMQEWN